MSFTIGFSDTSLHMHAQLNCQHIFVGGGHWPLQCFDGRVATLGTPRPSGEVLQKGPTNWKKMPRLPRLRRIQTLHPPWPFSSFLAAAPYVLLASNWLILVHFDLCRIWMHLASPLSIWCIARIYRKTNLLPCKTSSTPRHVKSLLAASNAGPGTWIFAASWLFEKLCGKQSGCCETKMYLAWCWLWHRFGHEACTGTLPGQQEWICYGCYESLRGTRSGISWYRRGATTTLYCMIQQYSTIPSSLAWTSPITFFWQIWHNKESKHGIHPRGTTTSHACCIQFTRLELEGSERICGVFSSNWF